MTGNEGKIPLADGFYLDTTQTTVGHYALSEDSRIAKECPCDIDGMVGFYGPQAVAELCMRNAMSGGGTQEAIVEVVIDCEGPQRRLLGGKKCGAKIKTREVALPADAPEAEVEDTQIGVPEIMPGVTFLSLVEDCIENPERSMENDGLFWTDKTLALSGVSPSYHISVGSRDGVAIEIDINDQSGNPFTPPRIQCDLSGKNGQLELKHNDVADEGGRQEYFAMDDRVKLDARVTELFKKYFVIG